MAQASIFSTTAPQQSTNPPSTQTPPPDESQSTTSESQESTDNENTNTEQSTSTNGASDKAVVRMPDGSEVDADQYVQSRLAENESKYLQKERELNAEWERVRQSALNHAENGNTTQTQTETKSWEVPKIDVNDPEAFQSDVEKTIVSNHNQLGERVAEIGNTVSKDVSDLRTEFESKTAELDKEIQTARNERINLQTQRQIERIERTKGITEQELDAVYQEYNGTIADINALAEIVELRKARETASEERTTEANEERKEAVSNISGGANSAATGQGDEQPKGRGLEGKDRYNGAAIAAKYKAFN